MDEQTVNNLIRKGIEDYMVQKQFTISKIPNHTHNGTDTNKIDAVNVNSNLKYSSFLIEDISETFVITNVFPNLQKIDIQGFAANNKTAPATKRAVTNGEAWFGNCFQFSGVGYNISANAVSKPNSIITSCNALYIDTAALANSQVSASSGDGDVVNIVDNTGTSVARLQITDYSNNSITFVSTMASDWKLQVALTFT